MRTYIVKRLLLFIPTLLGVVLVNFGLIQLVPGGPVDQAVSQMRHGGGGGEVAMSSDSPHSNSKGLDQEQIEALKKLYGFDKPWYARLGDWIVKLFTFDFGDSYYHNRSVAELIIDKLPVSISLGVWSFFATYLVCIPLGIAKAVRDGSVFDAATSTIVFMGYSMPGFVLGVLLIVLFGGGSFLDWFPLRGLVSDNFDELSTWGKIVDYFHHLTLPLICTTIGSFAVMTTLMKNTFLDNIQMQYVRTARAKGVGEKVIRWKHIFRNSLIPLVTGFAGSFLTMFFGASLLIETLFSLDGLGYLSYHAVLNRDYPIVMASAFFFSLLMVFGNLIADVMYVIVDPRISFDSMAE